MKWLLLFLTACTITGSFAATIPEETNIPVEAYFCQTDDCISIMKQFENANCAIYNNNLLEFNNIITKDERKNGLMHNKFCVKNESVITGSLNPTKQNVKEANNLLWIHSRYIAAMYQKEYEELRQGIFGSGDNAEYPEIILNNHSTKVRFCPEDKCRKTVLEELGKAQKTIHFALNAFTDDAVGDILVGKSKEISVKGILDSGTQEGSEKEKVKEFTETRKNIHHKFFVIDGETVITGSANPSRNGYEKNDENIVVINNPEIAQKYEAELLRLTLE